MSQKGRSTAAEDAESRSGPCSPSLPWWCSRPPSWPLAFCREDSVCSWHLTLKTLNAAAKADGQHATPGEANRPKRRP
jgi:hypothetical protein